MQRIIIMNMKMTWRIQLIIQISIARESVHLLIRSDPFVSYPLPTIQNRTTKVCHSQVLVHSCRLISYNVKIQNKYNYIQRSEAFWKLYKEITWSSNERKQKDKETKRIRLQQKYEHMNFNFKFSKKKLMVQLKNVGKEGLNKKET